jgi:hypothetical protein
MASASSRSSVRGSAHGLRSRSGAWRPTEGWYRAGNDRPDNSNHHSGTGGRWSEPSLTAGISQCSQCRRHTGMRSCTCAAISSGGIGPPSGVAAGDFMRAAPAAGRSASWCGRRSVIVPSPAPRGARRRCRAGRSGPRRRSRPRRSPARGQVVDDRGPVAVGEPAGDRRQPERRVHLVRAAYSNEHRDFGSTHVALIWRDSRAVRPCRTGARTADMCRQLDATAWISDHAYWADTCRQAEATRTSSRRTAGLR